MEQLLKGDWSTGVVYDSESDGCELRVNGACVAWRKLSFACEREAQRRGVVLEEVAVAPVAVQDAPKVVEPAEASKPRCEFYKSIKRTFAVFQELGLPTDDEGMRAELSRLLGKSFSSRRELLAGDWVLAADRASRESWAH